MEISLILLILIVPIASSILSLIEKFRMQEISTLSSSIIETMLSILILQNVKSSALVFADDEFAVDYLSAIMIFALSLLYFAASIFSIGYIEHEIMIGEISKERKRLFYSLLNVFIFTMLLVVTTNNIVVMWIAIEATTIASTFLVGIYNKPESLEASWKYLILCSVGLSFSLYGTILFYSISYQAGLTKPWLYSSILNSSNLFSNYISMIKLIFIFLLVGFGTKAGLVPLHAWLPDAHSEAPAPVSALFSGILIECSMYVLMRYYGIMVAVGLGSFVRYIFLIIGLLSMFIASMLMITARDVKRLLAFSSIEQMGIIACGLGFGSYIGIIGAVFQLISHTLIKGSLFLSSGAIMNIYNTRNINRIRGIIKASPVLGTLVLLGMLGIVLCPPFSTFYSGLFVVMSGAEENNLAGIITMIALLVIAFAALVWKFSNMLFGKPSTESNWKIRVWVWLPILLLISLSLIIGIYPGLIWSYLENAAKEVLL
ncbi:hydrogenase 4 subunit F [Fervidicoccus fontis]|uniref:Hydrogenase 4 subunit F n=1 Tax=Fervidicoccus fontis TaxID=683846 RepID=A0A843A789_9CREN|nr:proton-conducting transporter membrane subunit [Fervidicoccus fontis]MBE9390653.1 hydrogenase 4 subunit F [Fervidicoccus fontis]